MLKYKMNTNKMSSIRKKKLSALAKLMIKQNEFIIPITKPLLDCLDIIITPEFFGEYGSKLDLMIKPSLY